MSNECPRCHAASHNANDEALVFLGIEIDAVPYRAGWDAHAAGAQFQECPHYPRDTRAALSWRVGWTNRALQTQATGPNTAPGSSGGHHAE